MVVLYERYRPRVIGFTLRMTGDLDLAEEVFLRPSPPSFGRWSGTSHRRIC